MDDAGDRQHCDEHRAWEPEGGGVADGRRNKQLNPAHPPPPPPPPSSKCAKKSRRSTQKRVVSVAVGDGEGFRGKGGGAGEAFPPSDSWQWRKYGQKPIKGSPYPRGYYRCSSCKGCPARKQVERSRLDPNVLVVAYSFEHNHPWPLPKNARRQAPAAVVAAVAEEVVDPPQPPLEPASVVKEEKHYHDEDIAEDEKPLLTADEGSFRWFSGVASPCSTSAGSDELLYGSDLFAAAGSARGEDREAETLAMETAAATAEEEDEDSLFAGLGELPEYSVVLRRGLAAASWVGTNG